MTIFSRFKVAAGAAVLCATVVATTSCSLGPQDVPTFDSGTGRGYDITLHFASVMSLPTGAYVMIDGLRVGKVEKVDASGPDVVVTAGLQAGTRVPSNIRAVIRQDTLLGDTYIGLDHDPSGTNSGYLQPGGTVPVSRTTSPPQLEDTIAVLAYFVNGGSIQKVEDAMTRVNAVMPEINDVRKLAATVDVDMHDLSNNTAEIDRTLAGFDQMGIAIGEKSATLNQVLLNDSALHYWHRAGQALFAHLGTMLPSIGSIFEGGMWLVPMLDSLAATVHAGRGTWDTAPQAVDKLATFLRTDVLPFAQNPSVNIRSIESPQGDELIGDMENVLRMLGAVK